MRPFHFPLRLSCRTDLTNQIADRPFTWLVRWGEVEPPSGLIWWNAFQTLRSTPSCDADTKPLRAGTSDRITRARSVKELSRKTLSPRRDILAMISLSTGRASAVTLHSEAAPLARAPESHHSFRRAVSNAQSRPRVAHRCDRASR